MKNKFFCILIIFSAFFAENLFAEIRIGIVKGMDSIPFAFMYSDNLKNQSESESENIEEHEISSAEENPTVKENKSKDSSGQKYSFQFFETPFELFSKMKQGFIDATIISSDSAKKLSSESNGQIRISAVVSDIDFKIITRRKGKILFSDLIGNKIYVAGEGSAEKLLLNLLEKNSIPVEEGSAGVEIVVKKSQMALVSEFVQKKADYVLVSEPAVSDIFNRSKNAKVAIDFQEQCERVFGYGKIFPRSVLVVRSSLIEDSPAEFKSFLSELEYSVQRATKKPREASRIVEKNNFGVNRRICAQAICGTKFNFFPVKGNFEL